MSMTITIPSEKKETLGEMLKKKGFFLEASHFFKYSYFSKKDKETVNIECNISIEFLDALDEAAKTLELRGLMTQARQLKQLIEDPEAKLIKSLKGFASGVINYLSTGIMNGWLYKFNVTQTYSPYLVQDVDFSPAKDKDDRATTVIRMSYNCAQTGKMVTEKVTYYQEDVIGQTIPDVLAGKGGFFKESAMHRKAYDESIEFYQKYQPKHGEQFRALSDIRALKQDSYRNEYLSLSSGSRLVNNEEGIGKERCFGSITQNAFWAKQGVLKEGVNEIPFHPRIFMFDLEDHVNIWVDAQSIKPYEYDPSLKDKIVLPKIHEDLISILIDDMDVVKEDFIEGKSGGTIILCKGAPGLGKTLTAEIYSEVVKRPLYRVHSGQLGTDPDTIEKRLAEVLLRAERWGAILLLDEADIFIRQRSDDMDHNAIVASFLRRLEYYSGMLFMTTNRVDDVDDAILSRCSAILLYKHPDVEQRTAIWTNLSAQFGMTIDPQTIKELVAEYPVISGRDIKDLLKLADKYHRIKGHPLNLETFGHCAIFRGLEHRVPDKV